MFFFRCAQRGSYTQSFDNKQYLKCQKQRQKHTTHTGSPFHRSASEPYQSSPSVERLVHTWWRICVKKWSSDHGGHARFRLQLLRNLSKYYSLHAQDTKYIYIWNHQFPPKSVAMMQQPMISWREYDSRRYLPANQAH